MSLLGNIGRCGRHTRNFKYLSKEDMRDEFADSSKVPSIEPPASDYHR